MKELATTAWLDISLVLLCGLVCWGCVIRFSHNKA